MNRAVFSTLSSHSSSRFIDVRGRRRDFGEDFHRGRFEAARRKLQRQLRELWARAGRLAEEIDRSRCQPGAQEALRQLRRFVDRFEATEVKRLREDDPKKVGRRGVSGACRAVFRWCSRGF